MAGAGRKQRIGAWLWACIAALAAFELVAHPVVRASIVSDESWEQAASFVRARFAPNDRLVAAPSWADPIVRHHLGDLTSLRAAAPPDLAGLGRVWELAIRGATTRDDAPQLDEQFGGVRVRMWPIESPRLLYDFVAEIDEARVVLQSGEETIPCPWSQSRPGPGGLERGPMKPALRFVCDPERPWLWVGATIIADLDLRPRRCIWQHPAGPEPVRATFRDVALDERIVVHAGIDYQAERQRTHSPVTLSVWIDEVRAGQLVHRDGDGWARLEIDTSEYHGALVTVRFETTTPNAAARRFCYSASVQTGDARD